MSESPETATAAYLCPRCGHPSTGLSASFAHRDAGCVATDWQARDGWVRYGDVAVGDLDQFGRRVLSVKLSPSGKTVAIHTEGTTGPHRCRVDTRAKFTRP